MKIYQIETDVPLPTGRRAIAGVQAALRRTYSQMRPGDSFLFDGSNRQPYRAAEPDYKIATRKTSNGLVRVWLLAVNKEQK